VKRISYDGPQRNRRGSLLLETMCALTIASLFYVGMSNVIHQHRILDRLMEEKQNLKDIAQLGARLILDAPDLILRSEDPSKELARSLSAHLDLNAVMFSVESRPLTGEIRAVTVTASRHMPTHGLVKGEGVILLETDQ